jgi:hypothetical protein
LGLSTDPPRSNPGQLAQGEAIITLTQLIDLLTRFPRGLRVVVRGYEAGADDISPPRLINVDLAVNEEECYGPHAILDRGAPTVFLGGVRRDENGWRQ